MTAEERALSLTVVLANAPGCYCWSPDLCAPHRAIAEQIRLAIAEEKEACAAFVENIAPTEYVRRIAAAIRARP